MLRHEILQTLATVVAAADMDVEMVSTCIPFRFEMRLRTEAAFLSFSSVVTPTGIWVPCCGLPTITVVLRKVHLRTTWSATTTVAITADTTVRPAGIREIEVVVYIAVRSRQVHVPLDVATASHVE